MVCGVELVGGMVEEEEGGSHSHHYNWQLGNLRVIGSNLGVMQLLWWQL